MVRFAFKNKRATDIKDGMFAITSFHYNQGYVLNS